jgi:HlyD family secretion protein
MKLTKIHALLLLTSLISCNQNKEADAFGNFEATETIISAETNGKIKAIHLSEGDELAKGVLAVEIDPAILAQQKNILEANIQTIKSKTPAISSQLTVLQNQVNSTESQRKTLVYELERLKNLLANGAATPKQVDDIQAQITQTDKQIILQKSQLSAQEIALKNQTQTIHHEANGVKEQINQIQLQLEQARVLNPIKGTVTAKFVEENEIVAYGKPLYKIADLSSMILKAYFSGEQLGQIKLNQQVKIRVDAPEGQYKNYTGKIVWISPKAEFTPKIIQTKQDRVNFVYAVKIKVNNDGGLKMGMPGELMLHE